MSNKAMIVIAFLVIGIMYVTLITYFDEPTGFELDEVKQFASCDELNNFVKTAQEPSYGYYGALDTRAMVESTGEIATQAVGDASKASAEDYSTTNIQVEGVDEADIVKNDGKYIYTVSGNKVVIVDAYPAENADILSEIELEGTPNEIFVNGDKLVVFGYSYGKGYYYGNTFIKVYDVSDRANPVLSRDLSVNGSYYDSRMIGDYVYAIINQPIHIWDGDIPVPIIRTATEERAICNCNDVYYFDIPDYSRRFTTIMAVNTQNDEEPANGEVFVMGTTQDIYVSLNNIYITYTKRLSMYDFVDRIIDEVFMPFVPEAVKTKINEIRNYDISDSSKMQEISKVVQEYFETLSPAEQADVMKAMQEKMTKIQEEIAKEMEKTIIHKIAISDGSVEYKTQGYAPGNVLNQFSMDENNGYFRIATTTTAAGRSTSLNHLYVLDSELNIVGSVEDLAKGERIYSVRFIGDRAYMVTFRQIDPLFVIDLADPTSPRVLGFLKIPGVSDYLHPYDENHIIGVGRDATEEGRMIGMKLSLFEVTDPANPIEVSKYVIGDRGTSSEVLNEHKAFLFSKEKGLLVIPVNLVEDNKYNAFQGAYVFGLTLEDGFVYKGRITHRNQTAEEKYYYDYQARIRRSLYIDDVLYTISPKMIKMNELAELTEVNSVELPYETETYYGIAEETVVRSI